MGRLLRLPLPVEGDEHAEPDPISEEGSADSLYERLGAAYTVDHQAPVYLIDPDGTLRVLFTLPFRPGDVAEDVRVGSGRSRQVLFGLGGHRGNPSGSRRASSASIFRSICAPASLRP